METTTTYEKVFNFGLAAQLWLSAKPENANTKLGYAITRMNPRVQKIQQRYQNSIDDIHIDACATDEKGLILKDERGEYRFTREAMRTVKRRRQELFESEITIEPYFATDIPKDLSEQAREAFIGFIIQAEEAKAVGVSE
jgi:hypothetical protein